MRQISYPSTFRTFLRPLRIWAPTRDLFSGTQLRINWAIDALHSARIHHIIRYRNTLR